MVLALLIFWTAIYLAASEGKYQKSFIFYIFLPELCVNFPFQLESIISI